jgi:hypothetical protein
MVKLSRTRRGRASGVSWRAVAALARVARGFAAAVDVDILTAAFAAVFAAFAAGAVTRLPAAGLVATRFVAAAFVAAGFVAAAFFATAPATVFFAGAAGLRAAVLAGGIVAPAAFARAVFAAAPAAVVFAILCSIVKQTKQYSRFDAAPEGPHACG